MKIKISFLLMFLSVQSFALDRMPIRIESPDGVKLELLVEIADEPHERAQGLMYRKKESMAQNEGMLFVWPRPNMRHFWMRNTLMPLDIIFFRDGAVVGVLENMKPLDETSKSISTTADMAVEVHAGTVQKIGIKEGWQLSLTYPQEGTQ